MFDKILKASFIVIRVLIAMAICYEFIYIFIHDSLLVKRLDLFIFFSMLIPVLIIYFLVISTQIEEKCHSGHYFCHTEPDISKLIFEIILTATFLVLMNLFVAFLFFESVQSKATYSSEWSYNYLLLFFNFLFPFFTIKFQGVENSLTIKIKKYNKERAERLVYEMAKGNYKIEKNGFSLTDKFILRESGYDIDQLIEKYSKT